VAQVAIAVILVAGAALLVRTLEEAARTSTGLSADRLVFVDLSMPTALVADRAGHARVVDDLSTRLGADPRIGAVTAVNGLPYEANGWDVPVLTAEGQDAARAAANPSLNLEAVGPRHFETLGIPIARGRAFDDRDGTNAVRVAIVSDDVAQRLWPGQDAVGRRVKFGTPESTEGWWTIVGVAADVRYRELRRPRPTVYVLGVQFIDVAQRLAVRTTLGPASIASAVRAALRPHGDVNLLSVTPFEAYRAGALVRPRFDAIVAGLFAVIAWLVAALGVHAVIAASVGARRRELAIRSAIGATPRHLRRLVVGEAALLVGLGAAIGLAGGVAAGRILAATLDGVRAVDAVALAISVGLLVVAALLAITLPMRRAARTDPALTLRA
jgi:predicted permease